MEGSGCYNFDQLTDRTGTDCLKYDFQQRRKGRSDLLPLWVADMDFPLPEEILTDLEARVRHGIFGYTNIQAGTEYYDAVRGWFLRRQGWLVEDDWITVTPGVVYAICEAIRATTKEGDAVIIQQPVYYPFRLCIEQNGRKFVNNQLLYENGTYRMDLEDFEAKVRDNHVKLFILCSPHNPVGRVWTREELRAVADVCHRYGVKVFVDEIHADFIFPGHTFTPYASLGEPYLEDVIIGTSPSKTFNMAGLQVANTIIPGKELRARYQAVHTANGYDEINSIGMVALKSVYTKGDAWLDALLVYLKDNLDYVDAFLRERLPEIRLVKPEGTYLLWLDCTELGLTKQELEHMIVDEAHLWLDGGVIFGAATALFERINIACPRSVLEQAMTQLEAAVKAHRKG